MSIESVMPSSHLTLHCPILLLPSIFPRIRVFSNKSALHIRWPKYWRFSFSLSTSNEYSGLISFRIDWFDFLAIQGLSGVFSSTTVWKHQHSVFFMVQLSHLYMTTGKTVALTIQTFIGKEMTTTDADHVASSWHESSHCPSVIECLVFSLVPPIPSCRGHETIHLRLGLEPSQNPVFQLRSHT